MMTNLQTAAMLNFSEGPDGCLVFLKAAHNVKLFKIVILVHLFSIDFKNVYSLQSDIEFSI